MYGIYANIGGILMINVTIYGIHGMGITMPMFETKLKKKHALRHCSPAAPTAGCFFPCLNRVAPVHLPGRAENPESPEHDRPVTMECIQRDSLPKIWGKCLVMHSYPQGGAPPVMFVGL